jgi:hypothetical protein
LLSELSRDLLIVYRETKDIKLINKLLGYIDEQEKRFVLTPMNWRLAVQYFRAFIPHTSNWEELEEAVLKGGKREPFEFGRKSGNRVKKIGNALDKWLSDESNDIWKFSDSVEVKANPVDWGKKITNDIKNALDENKGNMSAQDVIAAIIEGGLTASDIVSILAMDNAA